MQGNDVDWSGVAWLSAFVAVAVAWAKKLSPLTGIRWVAEAVNGPMMDKRFAPIHARMDKSDAKLDKVCRVIDHMDGAKEAHAAVKAEDERWKA